MALLFPSVESFHAHISNFGCCYGLNFLKTVDLLLRNPRNAFFWYGEIALGLYRISSGIVGGDIFFPTEVHLRKHRQTNWGLVSYCQGKQDWRTLGLIKSRGRVYVFGLSKGDFLLMREIPPMERQKNPISALLPALKNKSEIRQSAS